MANSGFNREVAEEAALYWSLERNSLSSLINFADNLSSKEIEKIGEMAHQRIEDYYSWNRIAGLYEDIFVGMNEMNSYEE